MLLREQIRTLAKSRPIALAYLFGSQTRTDADRESDIDIGIVLDGSLDASSRLHLQCEFAVAVARMLDIDVDRVDTVQLDDASLLLRYNVTRFGTLLYARTRGTQLAYEELVAQQYDDELPLLERETNIFLHRVPMQRV